MKTKTNFRAAMLVAFFFCVCNLSAQLPTTYPITNGTTCNIRINYQFYDNACNTVGLPGVATVPSSGLGLSTPSGAFDIEITVIWVHVMTCTVAQSNPAVTGAFCPGNSFEPLSNGGTGCSCTLSGITVSGTGANIN